MRNSRRSRLSRSWIGRRRSKKPRTRNPRRNRRRRRLKRSRLKKLRRNLWKRSLRNLLRSQRSKLSFQLKRMSQFSQSKPLCKKSHRPLFLLKLKIFNPWLKPRQRSKQKN